jgi:tetratricopeptide (TPR) repeat protein
MRSVTMAHICGSLTAGALFSILLTGMIPILPAFTSQLDEPAALGKTKSMAEMQHEIVMILIRKKEYEKAAAEANKIFDMKWPDGQEPLLLKELLNLSDQFLRHGQASVSLNLIERNSKSFKNGPSRIAILKEKGYLYKSLKEDDKALDCFRQARELEDGN